MMQTLVLPEQMLLVLLVLLVLPEQVLLTLLRTLCRRLDDQLRRDQVALPFFSVRHF